MLDWFHLCYLVLAFLECMCSFVLYSCTPKFSTLCSVVEIIMEVVASFSFVVSMTSVAFWH